MVERNQEAASDAKQLLLLGGPLAATVGRLKDSTGVQTLPEVAQQRIGPLEDSAAIVNGGSGSGGGGASSKLAALGSAFWNNGVAVAIVSCLFFTLAAALVKTPLIQGHIPVFEIVVVRAVVSSLVTALSCRANELPMFGRTAPQWILIMRGVIGASAMTASYEALVRLPIADSTTIFYISPALTGLLAWLILGEPFSALMACGCAASLLGVVLVAQPPWLLGGSAVAWSQQRMLGTVFGLLGATLAASAYICIRVIGRREHPLTVAMYFHLAAFLTCITPLALGYPEPAVLPSPAQAALLLGIACGSFGGNLLVNRAFQLQPAAKASAINFTQVIFAYSLGIIFFHDTVTWAAIAGTALIAAGVIVVNLHKLMASSCGGKEGGKDVAAKTEQQTAGAAAAAAVAAATEDGSAGGGEVDGPHGGGSEAGWWWQRAWRQRWMGGERAPSRKAKRSDLEAELGHLPGFRYQALAPTVGANSSS